PTLHRTEWEGARASGPREARDVYRIHKSHRFLPVSCTFQHKPVFRLTQVLALTSALRQRGFLPARVVKHRGNATWPAQPDGRRRLTGWGAKPSGGDGVPPVTVGRQQAPPQKCWRIGELANILTSGTPRRQTAATAVYAIGRHLAKRVGE